jgi:hypothetical protein
MTESQNMGVLAAMSGSTLCRRSVPQGSKAELLIWLLPCPRPAG